jgi:hypothetical protein
MLVYSGSLLSLALCGIIWSRVMCPSSTQVTQPLLPNYCRLSSLAALQRDGPGGSTPRRLAHSQICDQWMLDDVSVHCHFFLTSIFLVEHSSNILSTQY